MKGFTLRAAVLALLMFLCVLFGMQQANNGIKSMKGYEDEKFANALDFQKNDGNLEASVLGEDVTSHDLQKKKQQLEEMKAYNLFSSMGKGVADGMNSLVRKGVDIAADLMDKKE
ncbi:DUF3679 domain-containing protein [Niallia nealsonii]|uniref:DUF3679 domain-containing protein n=1 Tax=Niallia nealsonii TaxID=115979 RepID=A0A2N0Z4T1_9BACI|nr:DUF3679 domain-containing protein [Niallia nealsonii]PKG24504.1 DUF3679 domain-containing protein [Niallia nealsonii]